MSTFSLTLKKSDMRVRRDLLKDSPFFSPFLTVKKKFSQQGWNVKTSSIRLNCRLIKPGGQNEC